MESESKEIPAESVAAAAHAMAERWKGIAIIPASLAGLFATMMIASQFSRHHLEHRHSVGGVIFVGVIVVGFPGSLLVWFLARARHYARIAKAAAAKTTLTWHISATTIAATAAGVPRPELTFSVTRGVRRSLIAAPRATLVR